MLNKTKDLKERANKKTTKIIEEIANEKRQEKQESLSKKYYETFLSSMENVTLEEMPVFKNGLSIKDKEGNEILLYEEFFTNYLIIDVSYIDGYRSITKERFNNNKKIWEVIKENKKEKRNVKC